MLQSEGSEVQHVMSTKPILDSLIALEATLFPGCAFPVAQPLTVVQSESSVVDSLLSPCLSASLRLVGLDPSIPVETKPMKCYNRKTKNSRFTKMEDCLLVEAVSVFVVPPVLSSVVVVLEPFGKITDCAQGCSSPRVEC